MKNSHKNINAIEKIIAELSMRDFKAAWNKLTKSKKASFTYGTKHGKFQYTLGEDTLEAIDIKHGYENGDISIEELKVWCLRWNLLNCNDTI